MEHTWEKSLSVAKVSLKMNLYWDISFFLHSVLLIGRFMGLKSILHLNW